MAVNSRADKTGSHKTSAAPPASYSQAAPSVDPLSGKIGTAGQKALLMRAKKILAPLADPNQAIVD